MLGPDRHPADIETQALAQRAAIKALAHRSPTEHQALPADESGIRRKIKGNRLIDLRRVIDDRRLRQPLERRLRIESDPGAGAGRVLGAAIPLLGARSGAQHARLRPEMNVEIEAIATDQPTRRMHDHCLTAAVGKGQGLDQTQRPFMPVVDQPGAARAVLESKVEARPPALGDRLSRRLRKIHRCDWGRTGARAGAGVGICGS